MFIHAACLLLQREVLGALAKLTESLGRWPRTITLEPVERSGLLQVLQRRWWMLRRQWRIDRLLIHGRASRLDYRRFPLAAEEFADGACEFVDDAWCQESRKTACEAEEEILIGMVPTHVQFQRDFAPPKAR